MALVDITVSRTLTINTGNYGSIKPSVSMTIKDIESQKVGDAYLALEDVLSGMIKLEIANSESERILIDRGLSTYCRSVNTNIETIGCNIEKALEKIENL